MKCYGIRIAGILFSHLTDYNYKRIQFYVSRIINVYHYGLFQARELLKMICRCAFNDSFLTDAESIAIIEACLDPRLDDILMEVHYNESW